VNEIFALLGCYVAYSELHYRRFCKTYRFHIQGSTSPRRIDLTFNMRVGPISCPETSVSNSQSTLRKIPKQHLSHAISVCINHKLGRSLVRSQMVSLEFFIDINPSDRTMALESTQPVTAMSTRRISWG
jgi:hypothetical protein